jgi:hypothetical protein
VRGEPLEVPFTIAGVRHDQVLKVAAVVHDQVVDDPALFVAEKCVLRMAKLRDPTQVVGEHPLKEVECAESEDAEFTHVPDVEDSRSLSHCMVLLHDASVLNGHLPTGERHHASTEPEMLLV